MHAFPEHLLLKIYVFNSTRSMACHVLLHKSGTASCKAQTPNLTLCHFAFVCVFIISSLLFVPYPAGALASASICSCCFGSHPFVGSGSSKSRRQRGSYARKRIIFADYRTNYLYDRLCDVTRIPGLANMVRVSIKSLILTLLNSGSVGRNVRA
jgi:hypothetical protein